MTYDLDILNRLFRKKSLPVPGPTAIFVNGFTSSNLKNIRAYAEEGYSENPIVYACISIISKACSTVKLEVHDVGENADKKSVVTKHPVLELLRRPNPMQTGADFITELAAWYEIAGEAFILRLPEKGPAKELYLLDPSAVTVEHDKKGSPVPVAYVYGKDPATAKRFPVNFITGESQVCHIKTFNPFDPFRGLPPMKAAARSIDIHNHGAQWNDNLLNNSARPSGIIEFENGSPDATTLSEMREYFKKAWQGVKNAGTVPILTGGAKFTALSFKPSDMDFEKSIGDANKNIAMVFGVPLPLVTMEAATHSNTEQAEERLWIDTVLPLLDILITGIGRFVLPTMGTKKTEYLAYNADSVPALEARRERLYKRMRSVTSGPLLSQNEARAEMGFDEKEGGDDISKPEPTVPGKPPAELLKQLEALGYAQDEIDSIFGLQEAA